jgi:hypothetical protein
MSTTTNAPMTLSDAQLELIEPVLQHFQQTDPQDDAARERLRDFLHAAAAVHPDAPVDAYFTYFLPDPTEGKTFLEKHGVEATGDDMREFVMRLSSWIWQ